MNSLFQEIVVASPRPEGGTAVDRPGVANHGRGPTAQLSRRVHPQKRAIEDRRSRVHGDPRIVRPQDQFDQYPASCRTRKMFLGDFGIVPRARDRVTQPELACVTEFESIYNGIGPSRNTPAQDDRLAYQIDLEFERIGLSGLGIDPSTCRDLIPASQGSTKQQSRPLCWS